MPGDDFEYCLDCACRSQGIRCVPCFAAYAQHRGGDMTQGKNYRLRTCDECLEQKVLKAFRPLAPLCPERESVCIECRDNPARPTAAVLAACPVCKRLPEYGHDDWCTPERRAAWSPIPEGFPAAPMTVRYTEPTASESDIRPQRGVSFMNLAASQADRDAMRAKRGRAGAPVYETTNEDDDMPAATIGEALNGLGITPATPAEPAAVHRCRKCDKPDGEVEFATLNSGALHANCNTCRAAALANARAAKKKPTDPIVPPSQFRQEFEADPPALTDPPLPPLADGDYELPSELLAGDDEGEGFVEDHRFDDPAVDGNHDAAGAMLGDLLLGTAAAIVEAVSGSSGSVNEKPDSVNAPPGAPKSLAELRAERERLLTHLARIDGEIEQAEAVEALGNLSKAELAALQAEAFRTIRLTELALQAKAG